MSLHFNRTKPFRDLQKNIGSSTYRLNTIFVGLKCIADGEGDGGAIAVSWKKPSPENREDVANQARIFACASALIFGADTVESYLRRVVDLEWANLSDATVAIVTKSVTKPGKISYSVAERVESLYCDLGLTVGWKTSAVGLMALWRNVVAHSELYRKSQLSDELKASLVAAKQEIYQKYSHLDIELAISNFEARKTPVGKEVTSLLAIASNICREIDEAIITRAADTDEKMIALTEKLITSYFSEERSSGLSAWSELSEVWQGSTDRRQKGLEKILQKIGISRKQTKPEDGLNSTNKPKQRDVSVALPVAYIDEIITLDRSEFSSRFSIPRV